MSTATAWQRSTRTNWSVSPPKREHLAQPTREDPNSFNALQGHQYNNTPLEGALSRLIAFVLAHLPPELQNEIEGLLNQEKFDIIFEQLLAPVYGLDD